MADRVEPLGEVAWDVLTRMVRDLAARKPGGHLLDSRVGPIDLRLPLALSDSDEAPAEFAARLTRAIDTALDDAIRQAAAFRPGHVFCLRCASAECPHSAPPSCRHVFVGFAATGAPRWADFAQLCLDHRHPEVDRLYDASPALLTIVQGREDLHARTVTAFDDGAYELLGQVTAGFFPVRARAEEGRGVVAITVQVASSRARGGRRRLGLNLLGRSPSGEPLETLWDRQDDLPWHGSVRWAQGVLETMRPPARGRRGGRGETERRVDGILRGLARRLERDRRARTRRTRHAERRHASGERPTRKAVDDARAATDDAFMVDARRETLVILGDRGRTHFFTPEGRLVSSVRYSRDAVVRKVKLDLWRPATGEERETLRRALVDAAGTEKPADS